MGREIRVDEGGKRLETGDWRLCSLKRGSPPARAVQSDCPGPLPLSPIALQTHRIDLFVLNLRVCSAMKGIGRNLGQRLAL